MRLYEGMFLVDHNVARTNFADVQEHIHGILTRFNAEVVQSLKWGERKLAYPVHAASKTFTKGAYILVHFNASPEEVIRIDRQFRLSEQVLRHFIVRDEDGLWDETKLNNDGEDERFRERSDGRDFRRRDRRDYDSDSDYRGGSGDDDLEVD